MAFQRDAIFIIIIPIVAIVLAVLSYFIYSKSELTVTNKRVFGHAIFGKRVDLPLDSISAFGTSIMKGIEISTASGVIRFKNIKNNKEIHNELSKLIIDRQKKEQINTNTQKTCYGIADELKEFKELLDSGIITQEEFETKKKQLLNK